MQARLVGAIEGGGTKFVCAVARAPGDILESTSIPTTTPAATLDACVRFLEAAAARNGPLAALGVACFGPIVLDKDDANFGRLRSTPKEGWSGADVVTPLAERLGVPVALDTDVAAAADAEWRLGAGRGLGALAYVTVGTGIGGAVAPRPSPAGALHAEMGHLLVRRDPRDDFAGICPFHGDCLEGLASGPAILARWGRTLSELPSGHLAHGIVAGYLGQLAASITLTHGVDRIVFGGGVTAAPGLRPAIRRSALGLLNGYVETLNEPARADAFVSAPALGGTAGLVGALLLADAAA